ncbi:GNAT family N-acetyltransferase [Nocardioides mesophilus]|uniref:GNAT family N-acetyltransferase n=1 Tax=Nocardioides mesophilus TaxID=433659 RepID=A0A7G9R771_9ACTN|nr:GNAT family N-acetyltransferase [Nocardioides mesophilus]QNN51446.1 GNAT family N-acetyltransferase [Nocardioides mesophilus]
MSALEIRPLDAHDEEALAAWHATYLAGDTYGRAQATPWMLEEMRADFTGSRTGERFLPFSGHADGTVVAAGLLVLPLLDNLTLAHAEWWTHPDHRRRGHGSAMLEHLTRVAREHGRTTLGTETSFPFDAPADGAGHPHADFLTHRGFTFALGNVMRVLPLPPDLDLVRRRAEEAAPYHSDYTLRRFVGPVPDDIVLPFGALIGSLMTEAPLGAKNREAEVFDEERIRSDEAVFAASGRTKYTTVAIAPDGAVVAYSEVVVPRYDPDVVYQWGTLVLDGHRGHRLGMATKAHNLLWLVEQEPDRSRLVTFNAEVNRHMIAVNEALGFRPVERHAEFEKELG